MPFLTSVGRAPSSLEARLLSRYPTHHRLESLVIPFSEGDARLFMNDRDFKAPIFRLNQKRGVIEVFNGGMSHLRDHVEVERDFRAQREDLDKRHASEQATAKADIIRYTQESNKLAKQLEEAYNTPNTSALRLGKLGDDLSTVNIRLMKAREAVTDARPKISGALWLAMSLNAPDRLNVGEIGREVARLRDRVLEEFDALPKRSTCKFDSLVSLEVTWKR